MDKFEISVKSDEEGFILLQCSLCGEFFKLLASELNDEANIYIWCPYCGLNGKKYFTEEVLDIGLKMVQNEVNNIIYQTFKDFERKTENNKFISFKGIKKPQEEIITPIKPRIDDLEIIKYNCCKTKAKIKPVAIYTGSYCPLCGGANFE